jgi:serine/threonine protein kinase
MCVSVHTSKTQEDEVVHLEDVYHLGAVLGEGGFAKVIKGTHLITGNQVAIKSIDLCKIQVTEPDPWARNPKF